MNKRKIIITAIGLGILALGIVGFIILSGLEKEAPAGNDKNGTVVNTEIMKNGPIQSIKEISGRLRSHNKVDLFAEVSGIARYGSTAFKSGNSFKKGQVLIQIDDSEFKSGLISTKSQFLSSIAQVMPDIKIDFQDNYDEWQEYLNNFDIKKPISALPEVNESKFKLFLSGRGIYTSYYKIKEAETRLAKFTIRAPFDGSLTETFINEGTLVRIGQQLGEFMQSGIFDLEASVDYETVKQLDPGMQLEFKESRSGTKYIGKLSRINEKVEQSTQLVKIFFLLKNKDLRSGMYLNADVSLKVYENATKIPFSALVDESYVYLLKNGKAKKAKIKVLERGTEFIICTGIPDNSKLITDNKSSAFEGSEVLEQN